MHAPLIAVKFGELNHGSFLVSERLISFTGGRGSIGGRRCERYDPLGAGCDEMDVLAEPKICL